MLLKVCPGCKIKKTYDYFQKSKTEYDGLQVYCKVCRKEKYFINKKNILEYHKVYYKNNKDLVKQKTRNYEKEKYHSNYLHKLRKILRARLRLALKNNQKTGSAVKDLGCTVKELKNYLETKFYPNSKTRGINDF